MLILMRIDLVYMLFGKAKGLYAGRYEKPCATQTKRQRQQTPKIFAER
ncbi:hypothetical protein HMPREF6485_0141 [Segatella buccae ATCC 33574]|uniref:Uncharacterized protein n=1 Tax=Segatella buccae ATCC 33574 TaxID=873513 RepID=E6K3I8_9BACT|nr:hypothetical protein HMPREF6485_0141 [Segatella buccae ATCC 33574]